MSNTWHLLESALPHEINLWFAHSVENLLKDSQHVHNMQNLKRLQKTVTWRYFCKQQDGSLHHIKDMLLRTESPTRNFWA